MNRSYPHVRESLQAYHVPVRQIDRPMMERAVEHGGQVLVIATHGPTMESTKSLLQDVAAEAGKQVSSTGILVESAWKALAFGNVEEHNGILAQTIRDIKKTGAIGSVVLAQLSMSIFLLSYPDPQAEFGLPVYSSGQCGFEAMRELLVSKI